MHGGKGKDVGSESLSDWHDIDAGGGGSDAASCRSAARCAYAKLCLDCSKGKGLGLAGSRVQQPHEGLVAAG